MFSNFPGQFVPFFTKCGDQGKEVEDVIYIVIRWIITPLMVFSACSTACFQCLQIDYCPFRRFTLREALFYEPTCRNATSEYFLPFVKASFGGER